MLAGCRSHTSVWAGRKENFMLLLPSFFVAWELGSSSRTELSVCVATSRVVRSSTSAAIRPSQLVPQLCQL